MNAVDLVQRLRYHRSWVNGNLLSAVSSLSDEQLRLPFQIGQGSIWKSLLHLYAAEYVWLETLLGIDDPILQGDLPGKILAVHVDPHCQTRFRRSCGTCPK